MTQTVTATCHCGAIQIAARLIAPIETARRCDCSFCRRRQAANVSADWQSIKILKGDEHLGLYTFGTKTAQHYFCRVCGIYTHHRRRSKPSECGVNVYCIDGVLPEDLEPLGWADGINFPLEI